MKTIFITNQTLLLPNSFPSHLLATNVEAHASQETVLDYWVRLRQDLLYPANAKAPKH